MRPAPRSVPAPRSGTTRTCARARRSGATACSARTCSSTAAQSSVTACASRTTSRCTRGVTLADDVMVGPSAVFTNDRFPRAARLRMGDRADDRAAGRDDRRRRDDHVRHHAGSRGRCARAGAVVTHDVAPNQLVLGNPARARAGSAGAAASSSRATTPPTGSTCSTLRHVVRRHSRMSDHTNVSIPPKLVYVIPVHNEEAILVSKLEPLVEYLAVSGDVDPEMLLIENGSRDASWDDLPVTRARRAGSGPQHCSRTERRHRLRLRPRPARGDRPLRALGKDVCSAHCGRPAVRHQ